MVSTMKFILSRIVSALLIAVSAGIVGLPHS
ncbi:MAG: hypothetical protein QG572_733, partial [Pseudomonadota bacterium]|nr:hypothetical protein [Pseudomonadota bacterium]